ncbi:hypothetical protein [Acidihalobacter ferrooxydans]|uniref:Uncharacterized protein n=1 Tax=Acidihalobacter ferrooxydans TaxID=1765967 RepID=A0A1P8UGE8_9GAMM|nr:hypothetical protein [Acidihalobacter ferrooxydans]APZ42923.1 hypothetical protein BW247_07315 [Acidihalobacter ferrooxydans]
MKKKKPDHIPLESLFKDDSFLRHAEFLFHYEERDATDPRLKLAILGELARNAGENVRKKDSRREQASSGGKRTGEARKQAAEKSHQNIANDARQLLQSGKAPHELAGILSPKHSLTKTQIRNILHETGVKPKKRK